MKRPKLHPSPMFLEALEPRIAPAAINEAGIAAAVAGSSVLLKAGEGLGSNGSYSGGYFLYVEKGQAMVFTTDLDGNGSVDSGEITGIAAGDGLRLVSFVDIHGDIVTNLDANGQLTDSDGDAFNGRDGKLVLNSKIEGITMRSVTDDDVNLAVEGNTGYNRLLPSDYSIYGNIFAGGGLGVNGGSGLTINTEGFATQQAKYNLTNRWYEGIEPIPTVGAIYTGTAVSGKMFSFGTSPDYGNGPAQSLRGELADFFPAAGQAGGDVIGVKAGKLVTTTATDPDTGWETTTTTFEGKDFHIAGIKTGDGGFGAKGGDIRDVYLQADVGGFFAIAGNGGDGISGGAGGSIVNLSIKGSPNSTVHLQTGDGGQGLLGAAGAAGVFQPNNSLELYGNVTVGLGKGGDALGNAGAGTSLKSADIKLFSVGGTDPAYLISSYHAPGDLGNASHFDFDGDGNDDAVFITQNTQQLAVAFGNGAGGFKSGFLVLDPSIYAAADKRMSPVVVGDFNGDGLMDIASASSSGTSFGGIKTFINLGDDSGGNWLGFSDARYSPTPWGEDGVNTNMVAGDFTHDGVTDIALVTGFTYPNAEEKYSAYLTVLSGLTGANGKADGFFAADFGRGAGTEVTKMPILSEATSGFTRSVATNKDAEVVLTMKATATTAGTTNTDVIVLLTRPGSDDGHPSKLSTYDYLPNAIYHNGALSAVSTPTVIKFSPRTIVQNETTKANELVYGKAENIKAYDFAIGDADGDNNFDPVVFGVYDNFTVASVFKGAADGTVAEQILTDNRTNSPAPKNPGGSYYGIAITAPSDNDLSKQIPRVIDSDVVNEVARAVEADASQNMVAFGAQRVVFGKNLPMIQVFQMGGGFGQYNAAGESKGALVYQPENATPAAAMPSIGGATVVGKDSTRNMFFDAFPQGSAGFAALNVPVNSPWIIAANPGFVTADWLVTSSLQLLAGAGGFSYLGNGGAGGSLGAGSALADGTGSIMVTGFPSTNFRSGAGGSGFLAGGASGSIMGVAVKGTGSATDSTFETKAAGNGMLGAGGNAGQISGIYYHGVGSLSLPASLHLVTGSGGFGIRGGSAGNVLGNGDVSNPLVETSALDIATGKGGFGISAGGKGGTIQNFTPQMAVNRGVIWWSELSYNTGIGGDSAGGAGGAGGGIINSSPTSGYNLLAYGGLTLDAGRGGDGITGGAGGSIQTFINRRTGEGNPYDTHFYAGDGGAGVTGAGGAGGSISKIEAGFKASGVEIFGVLAGNGGLSAAAAGGAGGALSGVKMVAVTGSMMAAAGAGGAGFTAGGAGGANSSTTANASALTNGRVLGIAGDGGDASAVTLARIQKEQPAPVGTNPAEWALFQQLWAMGTVLGRGGNGGSISGFTQPNNTLVSTDLIAGNGGSTLGYGYTSDTAANTGVGRGGSITTTKLAGDAGIIDQKVAIRSYVDYGTAISAFVADVRAKTVTAIDQNTGNVGVLAGNAGYVRNGQPASTGVAGSVTTFAAKNIMSMVAGSVDRIAAISSISGVSVAPGGKIGVYKDISPRPHVHPVGENAYWSGPAYTGSVQNFASPYGGGSSLWDGAVLTYSYAGAQPERLFDL